MASEFWNTYQLFNDKETKGNLNERLINFCFFVTF